MTPKFSRHFDSWQIISFWIVLVALLGVQFGFFQVADQVDPETTTWQLIMIMLGLGIWSNVASLQIVRIMLNALQNIDFPGEKWDKYVDTIDDIVQQIEKLNDDKNKPQG